MSGQNESLPEQVLEERNELYGIISKALGRLDALDPFGDGTPVATAEIDELRQWLSDEQERVIPPSRALTEGAA